MAGQNLRIGLLATALVFGAATAAPAQMNDSDGATDDRGFYVSGLLGLHQTRDSDINGGAIDVEGEFDHGLTGLLGLGFDFGEGWRIEAETGYREADVDSVSGASGSGDADALSLIGNVFYDFNLGGRIEPYIGAGLGLARVSADGISPVGTTSIDDDDTGIALQAGAGLAVPLNPRLKLTFDYRYLSVQDLSFTTASGVGVDADYDDHAVFVGLRFALNPPPKPMPEPPAPRATVQQPAPPPAPEPAPEPEPVRDFLVFFDWDSSVLTPQAQAILREAAATAQRIGTVRIVATGHADRSGPAAYNVGLSQRRADAVRGELIRLGLQGSEIATVARGETDPLVATPDGVREPQNRRVQIVLN